MHCRHYTLRLALDAADGDSVSFRAGQCTALNQRFGEWRGGHQPPWPVCSMGSTIWRTPPPAVSGAQSVQLESIEGLCRFSLKVASNLKRCQSMCTGLIGSPCLLAALAGRTQRQPSSLLVSAYLTVLFSGKPASTTAARAGMGVALVRNGTSKLSIKYKE